MGLLCGQRSRPIGFAEAAPSEAAAFYRTQPADMGNTIDVIENEGRDESPGPEAEEIFEGNEPYIRPQGAAFEDKDSDILTQ